jgi:branched-chain amino acid transport system permease protein
VDGLSERAPMGPAIPDAPVGVRRGLAAISPGLAVLLALAVVPLAVRDRYVLSVFIQANLYAAMAASWDVLSGYTGRENFGHALFIGTGAYTAALLNTRLHLSLPAGIAAGGGTALVFAILIGVPTLRLRGPYFALATLAAAGIMERLTLLLWRLTGGEDGVYGVQPLALSADTTYYVSLVFMAVVVLGLYAATRSPWGMVLRAIQANETACEACGLNTTAYKIGALLLSALPAGLAGGLYAHVQEHVGPAVYSAALSVTIIIMAFVGGTGTIYGAAAGGFILTALGESLRSFGVYRLLLYSAVLLPVIVYLPRGVVVHLLGWLRERSRWRS